MCVMFQNMVFFWPVFSLIKTKSWILFLCGKMWVRKTLTLACFMQWWYPKSNFKYMFWKNETNLKKTMLAVNFDITFQDLKGNWIIYREISTWNLSKNQKEDPDKAYKCFFKKVSSHSVKNNFHKTKNIALNWSKQ